MNQHGTLNCLNVGEGDLTLSFDKDKPGDRATAAKIVTEMIRCGYAVLVQVGTIDGEPAYRRAKAFDPEKCEYVVSTGPGEVIDLGEPLDAQVKSPEPDQPPTPPKRGPGRPRKNEVRVPAERARAVSVARSAGG